MINKNNFVVGVKDSEGNIITKKGDTFRIPFGTEYSFVIKNLNHSRAAVEILVDGTLIMGENKIIIDPHSKMEIDRFCIDGSLDKGNKLMFVEKDHKDVQDPTSENNGNVEFRFYLEKYPVYKGSFRKKYTTRKSSSINSISSASLGNIDNLGNIGNMLFDEEPVKRALEYNDLGATIEGDTSNQKFYEGKKIEIEDDPTTVISFNLKGLLKKEDNSIKDKYKSKVAFLLDKSASMSSIRRETMKAFNDQREVLLESPENVEVSVSLFTFSSEADEPILFDVPISKLKKLERYMPNGSTSMLDSVGMAIERLSALEDADDENTSFLLIIISDGQENTSQTYDYEDISNLICNRQNTGRWTVTYLGANQDLSEVSKKMSIDVGNIQLFNADSEGMSEASNVMSLKTKEYTANLSGGIKFSKKFYSDNSE